MGSNTNSQQNRHINPMLCLGNVLGELMLVLSGPFPQHHVATTSVPTPPLPIAPYCSHNICLDNLSGRRRQRGCGVVGWSDAGVGIGIGSVVVVVVVVENVCS